MNLPIMAHLVLGYPTLTDSLDTAAQYADAGCAILELQIPFSHPTADGSVITAACREAVENQHVSIADSLTAIRTVRERYPEQEIMVMSYINRIFTFGLNRFVQEMKALDIKHLIVPDLPVDADLAAQLRQHGVQLVPVLAANVTDARLEQLLSEGFDFFYLMSDFKITGSTFSLNPRLAHVIEQIRAAQPSARIGIGFGISTPEQAAVAASASDYAIIGSALITARNEGQLGAYLEALQKQFHLN
jgi:tryptophan synthase alpha chain